MKPFEKEARELFDALPISRPHFTRDVERIRLALLAAHRQGWDERGAAGDEASEKPLVRWEDIYVQFDNLEIYADTLGAVSKEAVAKSILALWGK